MTGDGTIPDWPQTGSASFIAYPGGGLFYSDGSFSAGGSYHTMRVLGTGAYGNGTVSASGYLNAYATYNPIGSDTEVDFVIYSAIAWLSGSVYDAATGAGLVNPNVTAYAGGTSYAYASGNSYNFGGNPSHPVVGGGLGVTRPSGVLNGPGSATYQVTAQASNYFSETVPALTLNSGQIATQDFRLYPTQGNIKGTIYDGSTGLPISVAPNILAVEAYQYAWFNSTNGTYTFAAPSQPPDWGLPVYRQGQSGPGSATYTLQVGVSGYSSYVARVQVTSGRSTVQDVYLYPGAGNTDLGPCKNCEAQAGQPVNLTNGNVWIQQRDYTLPGLGGGLQLARTWNSLWSNISPPSATGMFGQSWRSTYEEQLSFIRADTLKYWRGDGSAWIFHYDSVNRVYSLVAPPDERATLTFDSGTTLYTLTFTDGTNKIFNNSGYLTAIQDRNGNRITITYDASTRISQVTDAGGRTLSFAYNPSWPQLVASVQDPAGIIATYSYDFNQRLTQVKYADNSFMSFGFAPYSSSPLIYSVTDTNGKVLESHDYDGFNRGTSSQRANGVGAVTISYLSPTQTQVTDSASHVTTYNFQSIAARLFITSITGPGCATCGGRGNSTFTYDTKGNRTSSTDALGRTTTYSYDLMANVTSKSVQLDPNTTLTWSYTYNGFGQVLTVTDALGKTTTNTYDARGNLLSTTTPSPDGVLAGSTTSFAYDVKGQLTRVTDPRNNATTITYTAAGLIATIADALQNQTSYAYDARANRTTLTDALNKTTTFTYDGMNRLTRITYPDNSTTNFAYDTRGRRTSVTDGNGKATSYAYDDADRLISVTDAANNLTQYAYDTENNLTSINDALNRATSFTYDAFGRVTQVTFPSTLRETYTYDAVGNLLSKTDRKTQTISYTYDALNRLTRKQYPDSTAVNYSYDAASRLIQATDPTGTYQFSYDNLGRLTRSTTSYSFLTGRNFVASYAFDAASNRTSMTDPETGLTNYAYDALNRLTSLTTFQSQPFTFAYDALGRRTQMTRPNGVNTSYQYDALSRLLAVLHKLGAVTIDGASYAVDAVGNRTAKTDQRTQVGSNYAYDAIYQLTGATQGVNTTESYTYDPVGNRLSSLGVSPYAYNSSNQLTSKPGTTYTYDNNGNTLTRVDGTGTTTYAWDFENRLTSITLPGGAVVSFKYDPFGRRIQKSSTSGTSVYAYDGDNLIEETGATGTVVARYTQGLNIDEPLAMLRSGTTSYYQADGLRSVTSLTNAAGSLAQTYTFDSFGKQIASSGSLTNPFQFTARESDPETNLQFSRNRYYDPQAGRFLSEDMLRFKGGTNFYAYVLNNSVNYIDPLGFKPCKWYECKVWNWVPGVLPTKCAIWSHYCLKVAFEKKQEELAHPAPLTDDDLARGMGDAGKREIEICTLGDDNCKNLNNQCGGPILGLIFRPPFGVR